VHDPARAELEKIEASEIFASADRLRRFLRFAVEAKLNGQEAQIKEYVIGREVYDRDEQYDPRIDPIVRVEARRLRAKLEKYYQSEGLADPIRIELPKGSYVPVIAAAQESRPGRLFWWIAAGGILLLILLGSVYRRSRIAPGEMIAVAPAGWLSSDTSELNSLEESLAEAVAAELANRSLARVIAWPAMLRYRAEHKPAREMAIELGAAKVLIVSVRDQQGATRVTVFFIDGASNQKLWVTDFSRGGVATPEAQRELAGLIANEFAARKRASRP
jgi:TolB-like protein